MSERPRKITNLGEQQLIVGQYTVNGNISTQYPPLFSSTLRLSIFTFIHTFTVDKRPYSYSIPFIKLLSRITKLRHEVP